jgi:hypothetical protein
MPRTTQIVPSYEVPHIMTVINDNSQVTSSAATSSEDGIRFLYVFASGKGEDRVIKSFDNTLDFISEYGYPSFKLFGQASLMPWVTLASGNAKVYCERVMPDDACYSNLVIVAKVAKNATKPLNIKFEAVYLTDVTSSDSFRTMVDSTIDLDSETQTIPIIGVRCKGRGSYGNAMRFRITPDTSTDKDNNYRNYTVEVFDTDNGTLVRKSIYSGTLYENAVASSTSLFLTDVNEDDEKAKVEIYVNDINLTKIYNKYAALTENPVDYSQFDFLYGLTKESTAIENYSISTESVSFNATNGIALKNGTEGAFSTVEPIATVTVADETERFALTSPTVSLGTIVYQTDTNAKYKVTNMGSLTSAEGWELVVWDRNAAIESEYLRALSGDSPYDSAITSKRRTPIDLILDAGYSDNVKRALAELAIKRYDCRCILDAGILYTVTQAKNWLNGIISIAGPTISKTVSHYKTKDPFTAKTIQVTATYFYARYLPTHYKTYGSQIPFVGEEYAQLVGHIRNSVKPVIDSDDLETKNELYLLKGNFLEAVNENKYAIATQTTSQSITSDLSEESNVQIMLEMKRILEGIVKMYSIAETEDRRRFTENADRALESFKGSKVSDYTISYDMNEWETERNILHCYLGITFLTLNKTTIIEIDINKRT